MTQPVERLPRDKKSRFTVRDEVRRVMQILGPGGGLMIGAVHAVMDDVPPENVLAMVDTVKEFGHYPLDPGVKRNAGPFSPV